MNKQSHGHERRHFNPHKPRGGFREHRGKRRRMFDQDELQVLLLGLLSEKTSHGYELIREIESRSSGGYKPSPGVIYPALTYLEEAGLVRPEQDDASRKTYALTQQGAEQASASQAAFAALGARLASVAQVHERTDAAPIRRAMHGLKTAVFAKLSDDQTDRETLFRVVEIIDEAARKIERIEE
ncbi:MAG: PadR family transcriptional regulator [Novosphingobium sp.]|nr:PadR family transcriptional regulator [Novosphingobium sp.]